MKILAIITAMVLIASVVAISVANLGSSESAPGCGGNCNQAQTCGSASCSAAETGSCGCSKTAPVAQCSCGCGGACGGECSIDGCNCSKP